MMNKNVGHFLAFDKNWFDKHQRILLWFLNAPIIKYWSRWILRIQNDCLSRVDIVRLEPNSFTVVKEFKGEEIEFVTDFRTHSKFAKRLYFAFKPIWWLMHYWDELFADNFIPQWSFNFATLTQYPGSIGTDNPVDGYVRKDTGNNTLANIRAGSGDTRNILNDITLEFVGSATTNQWQRLGRALMFFDTSALTAGATISATVFSVRGNLKANGLGSPALHIAAGNAASTSDLAASDYAQANFGTTSFGNVAYASFSTSAYSDITLDANGIANVSKTGISKFSGQFSWDINNNFTGVWGSGLESDFAWIGSNAAGTTTDPKIVITYSAAVGPTNLKSLSTNLTANIKTISTNAIANVKSVSTIT